MEQNPTERKPAGHRDSQNWLRWEGELARPVMTKVNADARKCRQPLSPKIKSRRASLVLVRCDRREHYPYTLMK